MKRILTLLYVAPLAGCPQPQAADPDAAIAAVYAISALTRDAALLIRLQEGPAELAPSEPDPVSTTRFTFSFGTLSSLTCSFSASAAEAIGSGGVRVELAGVVSLDGVLPGRTVDDDDLEAPGPYAESAGTCHESAGGSGCGARNQHLVVSGVGFGRQDLITDQRRELGISCAQLLA